MQKLTVSLWLTAVLCVVFAAGCGARSGYPTGNSTEDLTTTDGTWFADCTRIGDTTYFVYGTLKLTGDKYSAETRVFNDPQCAAVVYQDIQSGTFKIGTREPSIGPDVYDIDYTVLNEDGVPNAGKKTYGIVQLQGATLRTSGVDRDDPSSRSKTLVFTYHLQK